MRGLVLFLSIIILSACVSAVEVQQRLLQAFDDVVFAVAPDWGGSLVRQHNSNLVRWEGELTYSIEWEEDANPDFEVDVEAAMTKITNIAGLTSRRIDDTENSNVAFHMRPGKNGYIVNGAERASCYAHIPSSDKVREQGILERTEIHMPSDLIETSYDCLEHEILHIMGFRGHSQGIRSVLAVFSGETELTKWDVMLLKTVYDPRLRPGMKREEALAQAKIVLSELLAAR